jgi:hypothetical protein
MSSHRSPISASKMSQAATAWVDGLDEVVAQLDRVQVLEDLVPTQVLAETLVQHPAGKSLSSRR